MKNLYILLISPGKISRELNSCNRSHEIIFPAIFSRETELAYRSHYIIFPAKFRGECKDSRWMNGQTFGMGGSGKRQLML